MDLSLFSKYAKVIKQQEDTKDRIIEILASSSGLTFSSDEIEVKKTKLVLTVSSVKKMKLHQVHAKDLLKKQGYDLLY